MKYIVIFLMNSMIIFGADFAIDTNGSVEILRSEFEALEYIHSTKTKIDLVHLSRALFKDKNSIRYTKKRSLEAPITIEKATYNLTTQSIKCIKKTYSAAQRPKEIMDHSQFSKLAEEYQYHLNMQKTAYRSTLAALNQNQSSPVTLKTVILKSPLGNENTREISLLVFNSNGIITETSPDTCHQRIVNPDGTIISWKLNKDASRTLNELITLAYKKQEMRK